MGLALVGISIKKGNSINGGCPMIAWPKISAFISASEL